MHSLFIGYMISYIFGYFFSYRGAGAYFDIVTILRQKIELFMCNNNTSNAWLI